MQRSICHLNQLQSMRRMMGIYPPGCHVQVLLHHEQFKIPENLARFAVKAGMGGFVKKMGPAVVNFVANRRQRVDPVRTASPNSWCPH